MSNKQDRPEQPAADVASRASVVLIDTQHRHPGEPLLKPGDTVRCNVIGRKPVTTREAKTQRPSGRPTVLLRPHRDCQTTHVATVVEYIDGDIAKYRVELPAEPVAAVAEPAKS